MYFKSTDRCHYVYLQHYTPPAPSGFIAGSNDKTTKPGVTGETMQSYTGVRGMATCTHTDLLSLQDIWHDITKQLFPLTDAAVLSSAPSNSHRYKKRPGWVCAYKKQMSRFCPQLLCYYATVSTSNESINSTSKCCAFLLKNKKGDLSHLASALMSILEALI